MAISGRRGSGACGGQAAEQLDGRCPGRRPASGGGRPSGWRGRAGRSARSCAGVEACPPRPSTRSTTLVVPFSVTPIAPTGGLMPGNASPAIAPPSSITNHGSTPRRVSSATASGADVPLTSSSEPKLSQTSWAGVKPSSSRRSTASEMATRQPLSSRVPRPQTAPSWISAENGGCRQGAPRRRGPRRGGPSARPAARRRRPPSGRAGRGCRPGSARGRRTGAGRAARARRGTRRRPRCRRRPSRGRRRWGCAPGSAAFDRRVVTRHGPQTRRETSSSRPRTPALR